MRVDGHKRTMLLPPALDDLEPTGASFEGRRADHHLRARRRRGRRRWLSPSPIRLDELRARLRETQAAAERLAGQIPPQGWASGRERSETAEEIQALVSILLALRGRRARRPLGAGARDRPPAAAVAARAAGPGRRAPRRRRARGGASGRSGGARACRTSRSPDPIRAARLQSASDGAGGDRHDRARAPRALANLAPEQRRRGACAARAVLDDVPAVVHPKSRPRSSTARLQTRRHQARWRLQGLVVRRGVDLARRGRRARAAVLRGERKRLSPAVRRRHRRHRRRRLGRAAVSSTASIDNKTGSAARPRTGLDYDLSWGIFFGAAPRPSWSTPGPAAAAGAGRRAAAAGRGAGRADRRRPPSAAPGRARAAAAGRSAPPPRVDEAADLGRARRGADGPPPVAARSTQDRPEIDGGTQSSFDEQE